MEFAIIKGIDEQAHADLESGEPFDIFLVVIHLYQMKKIDTQTFSFFLSYSGSFGSPQGYIKNFHFKYVNGIHMAPQAEDPEPVMLFTIYNLINLELRKIESLLF